MNIFRQIPTDLPEELTETLVEGGNVRIERIVSRGHASAPDFWYEQDQSEWVILLQGQATLVFADPPRTLAMQPGDYVLIEPGQRHRVESTSSAPDAVWLAVFF